MRLLENIQRENKRLRPSQTSIFGISFPNNISFPKGSKEWEKSETNNKTIDFNVLFAPHNMKIIRQVYTLKHNSKREH